VEYQDIIIAAIHTYSSSDAYGSGDLRGVGIIPAAVAIMLILPVMRFGLQLFRDTGWLRNMKNFQFGH
jgi:hypothetical protein